ncbi:MAG: hypothetical protein IH934_04620 [Nanoarchaeota archaeon]|nr:hypothetical protein [Nanoarchaeota archaeon]
MVLLEILALSQFKRFKKSKLGRVIVPLARSIDPDRTLRRLREQQMQRIRLREQQMRRR